MPEPAEAESRKKKQQHGARKQQFTARLSCFGSRFRLGLVLEDAALQQNGAHHRHAQQPNQQKRFPPAHYRHQQGDNGRGEGEAEIAGEGMHGKGAAHPFLADAAGQNGVIRRVNHAIADTREDREQPKRPDPRRESHGGDG
jgi:hypothetical protein